MIFDFDGTIADSFTTALGVFEDTVDRPQKLTPKEINELRGSSLREILKNLRIRKWQIPMLVFRAKKGLSSKMIKIKTFKGLPQVLKELHDDGHQMLILSTNSSSNIHKFLEVNGLGDYFDRIYGDIGLRGKAPALKKVLRKERISKEDCLYFGDETRDVEAAKKVGVTSVAVGWGYNYPEALKEVSPDYLAETPEKLLKIINS